MKIYIAGPMRGYPNDNHAAFDAAEETLRAAGHSPVSPAYLARALGKGPDTDYESSTAYMKQVMIIDAVVICNCDAIAVLPGWEKSRGATMEVALAQSIGLPIYDSVMMRRLELPTCPWDSGFEG